MPNDALLRPYDTHQSTTGDDNEHANDDVICLWKTRGMQINKRRTDCRIKLICYVMINSKSGENSKSMPNAALLRPYDICQIMAGNNNKRATKINQHI